MLDVVLSVLFSGDWQIGWSLEFVLVATAMHLMLEHNEKDYNTLLSKCCCGCSNYTQLTVQASEQQPDDVDANDTEEETGNNRRMDAGQQMQETASDITLGTQITTMHMSMEMNFIDASTVSNDATLTVPHCQER
eukprot:CAMPEP_0197044042 /NCGR_PEP_ID=MMETSP1384-20130603/20186_1 /TAXON_ID=29189 /ORGANISM="Ammonia sp." /LENGTH=134 /DNA_ID=CAMNT_0042475427 /DNA_START=687 /DNA_END=1091 /DNA_ORIENTATION=-